MNSPHEFPSDKKQGVYDAIYKRRDVRRHFLSDPIPQKTLARILHAAHHAPSVGFMQPWNFILIQDKDTKDQVKISFDKANSQAHLSFDPEKQKKYSGLKLEGILEAPLNICVTCDTKRHGPVVLGTTSQPNMDFYSTVCAIQNIWLAARSEGVGMGWVSILSSEELKEILSIPPHVEVIAYLCLGFVSNFESKPDLEQEGWLPRLNSADLIYQDKFDQTPNNSWQDLIKELENLNLS